jgi:hypothetical protein
MSTFDAHQGAEQGLQQSIELARVKEMASASWNTIDSAPFDRDLELAVLESKDFHALIFRCRRTPQGWINAATGQPVGVRPTHWREWKD